MHAGIDHQHQDGKAHGTADEPAVATGQLLETAVEEAEEASQRPPAPARRRIGHVA